MRDSVGTEDKLSSAKSIACSLLVLLAFIAVLSGAIAIVFVYESQTIWYKVGIDKTLLQAGHIAGVVALVLLFLQVILAVRPKLLVELFGVADLMRLHRINGLAILGVALGHVLFVLLPEGITNLPIGRDHWPEMIGAALFLLLATMVFFARYRDRLRLNYKRWRLSHKILGYPALLLLIVHVLFVSDTFEKNVPKVFVFLLFIGVVVVVVREKNLLEPKKKIV